MRLNAALAGTAPYAREQPDQLGRQEQSMRNRIVAVAAGFMALAVSSQASAQQVTADPKIVARVMQDAGYKASIEKLDDGESFSQSSSGGYPFRVFFFGCDNDTPGCDTVQMFAGFRTDTSPTLKDMNAYNRDYRWGRVYIDSDDDPVIEMDIDLEDGGMSAALFKDNLEYWDYIMSKFAEFALSKDQ
jgi:hypothetical protein